MFWIDDQTDKYRDCTTGFDETLKYRISISLQKYIYTQTDIIEASTIYDLTSWDPQLCLKLWTGFEKIDSENFGNQNDLTWFEKLLSIRPFKFNRKNILYESTNFFPTE